MGNKTESPPGLLLERGRIALEALRSREVAAQLHAASLELQLAMRKAESGDAAALDRWLETNRELLGYSESKPSTLSGPHIVFDASNSAIASPISEFSSKSTNNPRESTFEHKSESDDPSPWLKMLEGARRRSDELRSRVTLKDGERFDAGHNKVESIEIQPNTFLEPSARATYINNEHPVENAASDANLSFGLNTPSKSAFEDSQAEPILFPTSLQAALDQPADAPSNKSFRRWFLSSSVLGSVIVHLLGLLIMSVYVIRIANTTEPKSIVASNADSQEVSMEAPVEFSAPDSEQLDTSEPVTPSLPSFATQATETSSSSIQLPVSMAGVSLEKSPAAVSEAAQQATSISKSNAPTNMAEFFGVKAAGNTFC